MQDSWKIKCYLDDDLMLHRNRLVYFMVHQMDVDVDEFVWDL